MRELISTGQRLSFMRFRGFFVVVSGLLIVASIVSLSINKLNFGLDFTGGTLIEVGFQQPANLPQVRSVLEESGYADAIVQNYGTQKDLLIRLEPRTDVNAEQLGTTIIDALRSNIDENIEMRRIEFVGPNVGDEFIEQGGLAMLTALICILIYIALRFEWRLAVGAVAALAHDVIITLGLFSVFGLEFDLTVLAALLAVIGYSINDTVVVSDRIRETFRKFSKLTLIETVDTALTDTLSRTLITSLTTVLVLLTLFFLGGPLIHGFSTALLFGVVIGTYSSIFIASSVAISFGVSRDDLMPTEVEKEGADQDPLP